MDQTTTDKPQLAENVLERIRKCLAMAADKRGNEHEVAAAARQAEALLRRYNLDASDITLEELKNAEGIEVRFGIGAKMHGGFVKKVPGWAQSLAVATCDFFDCHVMLSSNPKWGQVLKFVGYKTDVEVCNWTFSFLMDAVKRFSRKFESGANRHYSGSYRDGVVHGIISNLREAKREKESAMTRSSTGTALVVAKRALIESQFGKFEYGTKKAKERDWQAYSQGTADGKSVNVKATPIQDQREKSKQLT